MARKTWTTEDGRQIKISEMDLAHLANTIRYLGSELAKAREGGTKRRVEQLENDLLALQTEHDSRDREISQAQGIFAALNRSLKKE